MGLEVTTTISGLVVTNPSSGDSIKQGDDHIVLIKNVLKTIFPGAGGTGFAIPITATEAQLNFVAGATSNIQAQINALSAGQFASGTRIIFYQAAPPTGWTQVTTHNNKMLRVVSGAGGGSGGVDSPVLMDKIPTHTHNISSIVVGASGAHTHDMYIPNQSYTIDFGSLVNRSAGTNVNANVFTVNGAALMASAPTHTHALSGNTDSNLGANAVNWQPLYIDTIIGNKT